MKTTFTFFLIFLIVSCSKSTENEDVTLSPSDLAAVTGMSAESSNLRQASVQLDAAITPEQRHHWDSAFHHHDSLHNVHHGHYNTGNNHPHNDHHHQWVPYDPGIDHSHHYHPVHPGHPHDSLIVVSNGHHPDHNIHHPEIHSTHDHHIIDSLHHAHQGHH